MIIPADRLLWIFAGAFLPVSLAWAFAPQALLWPLLLAGLLGLFAVVDAWRARSCLAGVRIESPGRFNLTHGREGGLDLIVSGELCHREPLRIGLALPAGTRLVWPVLPHNPYRKAGEATVEEARLVVCAPLTQQDAEVVLRLAVG